MGSVMLKERKRIILRFIYGQERVEDRLDENDRKSFWTCRERGGWIIISTSAGPRYGGFPTAAKNVSERKADIFDKSTNNEDIIATVLTSESVSAVWVARLHGSFTNSVQIHDNKRDMIERAFSCLPASHAPLWTLLDFSPQHITGWCYRHEMMNAAHYADLLTILIASRFTKGCVVYTLQHFQFEITLGPKPRVHLNMLFYRYSNSSPQPIKTCSSTALLPQLHIRSIIITNSSLTECSTLIQHSSAAPLPGLRQVQRPQLILYLFQERLESPFPSFQSLSSSEPVLCRSTSLKLLGYSGGYDDAISWFAYRMKWTESTVSIYRNYFSVISLGWVSVSWTEVNSTGEGQGKEQDCMTHNTIYE
ncbi:uncharacterized protein BDR25DRAFT_348302 [Lindgomyces ingoldianus]|uniref:Uncharacterized protein n=1 Tax=Lindgomyces ingoldianus TaxID=673940 RepID=A0ACB6RFB8_9PLEO|nr:uncharacterized protein BDR25DRAFT_348302 [Lindgomyces ingoldianus]KAF2478008.1 hypothetical protein BDR25DRAFT_348302 [Lindgomyces ingoldianus]